MRGMDAQLVEEQLREELPRIRTMAHKMWRRWRNRRHSSWDWDDLIQAGVLGFLQASRNYDPGRGVALHTFCHRMIWGEMVLLAITASATSGDGLRRNIAGASTEPVALPDELLAQQPASPPRFNNRARLLTDQLPEPLCTTVRMHLGIGVPALTFKEISLATTTPIGTVMARYSRAIGKLRKLSGETRPKG